MTVMARVASSPGATVVANLCTVFDRSLSASQPSGEKRSRICPALETARSKVDTRPGGIAEPASMPSGSR